MTENIPYTLELGGDLNKVSQKSYEALQKAITAVVEESGARWLSISLRAPGSREDAVVRKLFVNQSVEP